MRALRLLAILAFALPVTAGTQADPDIKDTVGDHSGTPAADLHAVWFDWGNRSLLGDERYFMDVHVEVGAISAIDTVSYDVTWAAANVLAPNATTSERGVRILLSGGQAAWSGLQRTGGAWGLGSDAGAVEVDAARGHLTARGVRTGGGALPELRSLRATSGINGDALVLDAATSARHYVKSPDLLVVPVIGVPDRPYDVAGAAQTDLPGAVDILGAWVDVAPDRVVATFRVRSLDAAGILACPWWDVGFSAAGDDGVTENFLFAHPTLRIEDGIVTLPFLGAELETGPRDDPNVRATVRYDTALRLQYGSPGIVRLEIHPHTGPPPAAPAAFDDSGPFGGTPVWNSTVPLDRSYRAFLLSCRATAPDAPFTHEDKLDIRHGFDVPAWPPAATLALAIAALAARRRVN